MGRKSKYDPKLHPSLIRWMARAGLIDDEISGKLGIVKSTLYRWAALHEAVAEALQESRDYVDSLVEGALLKRALGYDVEESKAFGVRGKDGAIVERIEKTKKHVPPDTTACIYWTKNRRRPRKGADPRFTWQDVSRVEVEPAGLGSPPDELTNDELDAEIRKLEHTIGVETGKAATPGGPGTPDTLH